MQHRLAPAFTFAVVFTSLVAGSAHAQRMPDMATLDRGDGITRLGLDFGAAFVDDDLGEATGADAALRFELFGQYVSRQGLGFYGALPISHLLSDVEDETALGNLEVGGLYVIESPAVSFVFRGGLALPTADDEAGVFANFLGVWSRLTDLALVVPDTTYVRLSFSPLYHAGGVFLRADIGLDLAVQSGDEALLEPENLFRLNVGGGVDLGTVALMAELVNIASTETLGDDDGDDEDFAHTFAVTARFMGGSLQPSLTFAIPIDDFGRDVIDFILGAGLQVAF
jgi:hypothetical protein